VLRLSTRFLRRARDERLPQVDGSLTFTTVLSLVPLLAVGFAAFSRVPALQRVGDAIRDHLLSGLLPPAIARTVLKHLAQFTANTGALTPLGAVVLVGTAVATVLTVENVLNRLWQVRQNRPLHRRLVLWAALLVVAPVLIGTSLWATSLLRDASGGLLRSLPPAAGLLLQAGPALLATLGFACLYRFVPHAPVRRREALAGGLLAGIAFEAGKAGFTLYLQTVPTYRTVYGAFAPLLAFLLWVYLSWLVTLAGALLAAAMAPGGRAGVGAGGPARTGRARTRRLSRA
jgi:membrane protein